jgi:hypothetical protein
MAYSADYESLYFDNYAEQKKRAGRCVRSGCNSEPTEGMVTCASCREKIYASRMRLRAIRAAAAKLKQTELVTALAERKNRIVRDGKNEFWSFGMGILSTRSWSSGRLETDDAFHG